MLVLAGLLAGLLAGCQNQPITISDRDVVAGTLTVAAATAGVSTPLPPPTATARSLQNPNDPLTIVLGGLFRNGGYWTWADIENLLGTYAEFGAFVSVTDDGVTYSGVPMAYLFDFAQVSQTALTATFVTRDGIRVSVPASEVRNCDDDCLLVRAADGSITAVAPEAFSPLRNLMRIEVR